MPEHASLHSVSVRVALIHGFIQHDFGLKSAHLPFRSGITPLSALVRFLEPKSEVNGLAGTRTQGLRLAKAAIFQLIYEPFLVVSYGPRIFFQLA